MDQHDPAGFRPALTNSTSIASKRGTDLLFVRLVRQGLDVVARHALRVGCMVANRTAEQHDGTALREHRPLVRRSDRQRITGQAEP